MYDKDAMIKVLLQETVAELDVRIAEAAKAVNEATEQFNYLKNMRAYLAHPRAASVTFHIKDEEEERPTAYGSLKRYVFSLLPETDGLTPQAMVDVMQAGGYAFRSKTPAISVNEALQTLKYEGKAKIAGKSPSGANLWIREENVSDGDQEDDAEKTPTEAGV